MEQSMLALIQGSTHVSKGKQIQSCLKCRRYEGQGSQFAQHEHEKEDEVDDVGRRLGA